MPDENKKGKNVCLVCGEGIDTADNNANCPVCEDRYFNKIKKSYVQNFEKLNEIAADLFKLHFESVEELTKSSYEISSQYLELEKNLGTYNPSWYYLLTSYQFMRNLFLGTTVQNFYASYSSFITMWRTNHQFVLQNIASVLENMNGLCKTINVTNKPSLSETDKNFIKMINESNRTYDAYDKENCIDSVPDNPTREKRQSRVIKNNNSESER